MCSNAWISRMFLKRQERWWIMDPVLAYLLYQQNVNRFGSHTTSPQALQVTSPVLLSTSRCSETPLELSNVLTDSTRALSGTPESTCSMEVHLGCYKVWLVGESNFGVPEPSAQFCGRLHEQLGPLCSSAGDFESSQDRCTAGDLVPYSHHCCSYTSTRHFGL